MAADPRRHWLLLRGLAREARHWGTFTEVFARVTGDEVHCLDLPGAGTETGGRCPTVMRGLSEDVRRRWLPLRDAHPGEWSLLGISLGGMVSMQWCADHPRDFARVVLVNTSAANIGLPWERMDWRVIRSLPGALRETDMVRRERLILALTSRVAEDLDAVAARNAAFAHERPMRRRNVLRQLAAASTFRAPPRLDTPALVVAGAKDPLASPVCGRRLAARFNAPLREHPEAGHDMGLDAPEWLAEVARDFAQSA